MLDSLFIAGRDGNRLHLADCCRAPNCLLLHGFGDSAVVWKAVTSGLSRDWRTLALDLRGHGDSDWSPEGHYRLDDYADDVCAIIERLDRRLILVGHSLGGAIAIRAALRRPQDVAGLVLVDHSPELGRRAMMQVRENLDEAIQLSFKGVEDYVRFLIERRPFARAEVLREIAVRSLRRAEDGSLRLKLDPAVLNSRRSPDPQASERAWRALQSVYSPTVLVRGEASAALSRSAAERMLTRLPNAVLRVVKRAGHAAMLDNPEGLSAVIDDFLVLNRDNVDAGPRPGGPAVEDGREASCVTGESAGLWDAPRGSSCAIARAWAKS